MRRCFYPVRFLLVTLAVTTVADPNVAFSAAPAHVSSSERKPATIDDAVALKSAGRIAVSPDAALIAVEIGVGISVIKIAEPGKVKYELKGSSPSWSPNGRLLAFLGPTVEGGPQINIWNRENGSVEAVTNLPGGVTSARFYFVGGGDLLAWSPDSNSVAFCSRELGPRVLRSDPPPRIRVLTTNVSYELMMEGLFRYEPFEEFPLTPNLASAQRRTVALNRDASRNKLFVVDVRSHELHKLTQKDQHFFPSWSPDGTKIACISDRTMGVDEWGPPQETQLSIFDVDTGNERRLTPLRKFTGAPQWSPDGKRILTVGNRRRLGFSDIQLLSVPNGRWSLLQAPRRMNPSRMRWAGDGKAILATMADRFANTLWVIDVETGASSQVNTDRLSVAEFDTSTGGDIVFVASDSYHKGRIYLRRHDVIDQLNLIFDANPQLANLTLGEQRRVTWRNSDGEEVDGILILPPNYESGSRYPLIVDLYPTPARDSLKLTAVSEMGQIEAALGYVVFFPAIRAPHQPNAFSREAVYTEKARGPKGIPIMLDDYQSGIEFLVKMGLVDRDRIGIFGHSNGGWVGNFLMTETKPGKCAVLSSTFCDAFLIDFLNPQWAPEETWMKSYIDGNMYDDIQDYIKMSPIFRLNRVSIPILMLAGDKDTNSVLQMTVEFNALRRLGKEVTFVRYADEGHGVAKVENQRDWRDRVRRFFEEQLKQ